MENNLKLTIKVKEDDGTVGITIKCDGTVEPKYLRGITRTVLEGLNEGTGKDMFAQHYIVTGINDFMEEIIDENILSEV